MSTSEISSRNKQASCNDNDGTKSTISKSTVVKSGDIPSSELEPKGDTEETNLPSEVRLYKDSFITIYPSTLVIHRYYSPLMKSKTIKIADIVSINSPSEVDSPWWKQSKWGIGLSDIWWALDETRTTLWSNRALIITVRGESIRKGFSVGDKILARRILTERMTFFGSSSKETPKV